VREFDYDGLGRLVADKVTTVGSGVDAVVRRIARAYEVRGMLEKLTSYDATSGGSALNEVLLEYDSAALLSNEYQEHGGAKDAETLYVQYNYDQSASSGVFTKGLRPTSLRYPNARLVHTTYGTSGSTPDALARVAAINADGSGSPGDALSEYTYLGLGTIVTEDYPEPDVKLDYVGDGSYSGFDRFGRVVDQKWYDYGASAVRDQYTYGYDRASNRLYRENTTASGKDELYGYDEINRLVGFDRGDLNGEKTAISGTPVREEDWTLDPLGNWPGYVQKTSGTTDLDQERTHNEVNEITAITATTGTNWADPVHDRAGNMTTVPKPSSLADGLTCTYDAWNRLVEVQDGETTIGRYEYDGLNRRIEKHLDSQAPDDPDGIDKYVHYFYNRDWQLLETRETTSESAEPEDLQPKHQHIWSLRYIDAPILRDENTDEDGLCDDGRLYYLGDANFNVTTLVDPSGDAVERYLYSPYGTPIIYDASWSSTRPSSLYTNPYLYTGREYDPESGLYHYRNRYYDPALGAFVCRDPIKYRARDLNLYRYVRNNPIGFIDALGWRECNAKNEGERYGDVSEVALTPGLQNPDQTNAALNLALLVSALSVVPFPVGTSPTSIEDLIGLLIQQASTGGPGTGLEMVEELAKLKGSLDAWKGITGSVASIWTKVQCMECKCTNWFPSVVGKKKWGWVADGKEKWLQCDLAKTTWGEKNDAFLAGAEDKPAGLLYDIVQASDLKDIMEQCRKQGEASCKKTK